MAFSMTFLKGCHERLRGLLRKRRIQYVLVISLVVIWVGVDRFMVEGVVVDQQTGKPISDAIVTATFYGESVSANIIETLRFHGECIGSYARHTNENGRYRFIVLRWGSLLVNKSVSIYAFKPGYVFTERDYWAPYPYEGAISAGLLGFPAKINVELKKDYGQRLFLERRGDFSKPTDISSADPKYQKTWLRELDDLSEMNFQQCVSPQIWGTILGNLEYAASRVSTKGDKEEVLEECKRLAREASSKNGLFDDYRYTWDENVHRMENNAQLLKEDWTRKKRPLPEIKYEFPYVCDESLFKPRGPRAVALFGKQP